MLDMVRALRGPSLSRRCGSGGVLSGVPLGVPRGVERGVPLGVARLLRGVCVRTDGMCIALCLFCLFTRDAAVSPYLRHGGSGFGMEGGWG